MTLFVQPMGASWVLPKISDLPAWLGFGSRLERKIVLLVLLFGVAPLALMAQLAMREVESQTLILAERQLRDSTKTYALELLDQLSHAQDEMRIRYLSGLSEASVVIGEMRAGPGSDPVERPRLFGSVDGIWMGISHDGLRLTGQVVFDELLAELGHVPYGINRCVKIGDQILRCAGSQLEGNLLSTGWQLPLSIVYDSNLALTVTSKQQVSSALSHVSLVVKLLPLVLLAVAAIVGWIMVLLIRRRVAPLAVLEAATIRIREGDYSIGVEITTGDELEHLGRAFNLMADRLKSSFDWLEALAEIDRQILSGVSLEEIIKHVLLLAESQCGESCYVGLFRKGNEGGELFRVNGETLHHEQIPFRFDTTGAAEEARSSLLVGHVGTPMVKRSKIRIDGVGSGWIFTTGAMKEDGRSAALEDLADRISVAATNVERAKELYRQANYDGLTGLINRQAFLDRLAERVAASGRSHSRGALLFLDLDRFKQVNDTRGHATGDELLRMIANRLQAKVRKVDLIARLGGDEFAVIVPEFESEAELTTICDRLIETVTEPVMIGDQQHQVDVSLGVSIYPDDGDDPMTLLMKADVAMYKAKEHSGSSFTFFDRRLNEVVERRVQIENRLRTAISEQELSLHYQPKMDLRSGLITEVEGLMRWHNVNGLVYHPSEFIPIAESTGLIFQFTRLLVEEASACLNRCRAEGLGLERVAVNISSRQFSREGFAQEFLCEVVRAGMKATDFEIEVTESVFIADADYVIGELNTLRDAGVHVALDDFGTGFSSLNMLRSLPLNSVKIDRSFITPLMDSSGARKVAQKIIEMAEALGLAVVAEGVESEEEIDLLRNLGCHYVQGYLIARPMPLDRLTGFLSDHHSTLPGRTNRAVKVR